MPISERKIPRYDVDGFVGPIDALTREEAKRALEEVYRELSADPETHTLNGGNNSSDRFKLHLILPTLDAIAHHPAVVDAVKQALQTQDVLLWSSDVNWKAPYSDGYFAPHQDSTYAGLSPPNKCLTAWVALSDPVGEREGCLSFYPQSHLQAQLPHQERRQQTNGNGQAGSDCNNNMLSLGQYISQSELEQLEDPVGIPLRAGQMTLHSFYTVHASGPNRSRTGPRVGLALRYIDANCVVQTKAKSKEMVTWISSSSPSEAQQQPLHNFELEPRLPQNPTTEDTQRMRRVRAEAVRREEDNYFFGKRT